MEGLTRAPNSVRIAQAMFFLNAAIWVLFGVWTLIRMATGTAGPTGPVTMGIIAALMAANAGVMLGLSWGLGRRQKRYY